MGKTDNGGYLVLLVKLRDISEWRFPQADVESEVSPETVAITVCERLGVRAERFYPLDLKDMGGKTTYYLCRSATIPPETFEANNKYENSEWMSYTDARSALKGVRKKVLDRAQDKYMELEEIGEF